ncbi:L-threonylcarbamoyladenylate synthase [Paracoccaceae bacterium]|nr:L-threonylcarbamoyladenylate synthase [Paracoccaceae bacterium]
MQTKIFNTSKPDLLKASKLIETGGTLAFPTETVYGLGADATNNLAVAKIFQAKGRPSFNPLIIHCFSIEQIQAFAMWSSEAQTVAEKFWPGPLTMVLPLLPHSKIASLALAGLQTVAVRIPVHSIAQSILKLANIPIAAPSANPSGSVSATKAEHVISKLNGKIEGIVSGGSSEIGLESTIISFLPDPRILRFGAIDEAAISEILNLDLKKKALDGEISAPGQLSSHYAPKGSIRLNSKVFKNKEVSLGFGKVICDLNLSRTENLIEAAANLFDCLHKLDEMGAEKIAVSPIPEEGIGIAINDRLKRAAAPK